MQRNKVSIMKLRYEEKYRNQIKEELENYRK